MSCVANLNADHVTSISGKAIYVTIMFLQIYYTTLHLAVQQGNYDIVHLLLEEGADVNANGGLVSNVWCNVLYGFTDGLVYIEEVV